MIIATDLDGVIANIFDEFAIRIKKDFDLELAFDQWPTHYVAEVFEEVTEAWVDEQLSDPTFFLNAKCYEPAWYMFNKWFMAGHDIHIVTRRGKGDYYTDQVLQITERWLDEWEINYNSLIGNATKRHKWEICQQLGADFLIEDDPAEVLSSSEHIPCYMLAYPYNSKYDIGAGIRINSLYELDKVVMGDAEPKNKQVPTL